MGVLGSHWLLLFYNVVILLVQKAVHQDMYLYKLWDFISAVKIGLDNGYMPNRQQIIIETNIYFSVI